MDLSCIPFARCFFTAALCLFLPAYCYADDRIAIDATINGQAVRLAFDTGASESILMMRAFKKLGLKSAPTTATVNKRPAIITQPVELKFLTVAVPARFVVVDFGRDADIDGVIGWGPLHQNVCSIDATNKKAVFLPALPKEVQGWTKLPLVRDCRDLRIELTASDGTKKFILIDTGSNSGVDVTPERWKQWMADHAQAPTTLHAYSMIGEFVVVRPQQLASKLMIGPIELKDVPVEEAGTYLSAMKDYEATIGLYALRAIDLVVDGPGGSVYFRPAVVAPPPFDHNRLGAVFVPADQKTIDLSAQVVKGSPADRAGIRDGDVLRKVDDIDFARWKDDSSIGTPGRFWQKPGGTKLRLTLLRGHTDFETTVTLEDILVPAKP